MLRSIAFAAVAASAAGTRATSKFGAHSARMIHAHRHAGKSATASAAPAPCDTLRCNSPCWIARPGSCGQCGPARLGRHPLLTDVASCLPIPAPSSGRGSADSCPQRGWLSRSLAQIPRRGRHNECGTGASYCTTSVGRARPTGCTRRVGRVRPGFWWGDS